MTVVRMKISATALMPLLRLPDHIELVDGIVESGPGYAPVLTLMLEVPDAPEGAADMEPVYTRASGWPDPFQLTGIFWYDADGIPVDVT